MSRAAIMEAGNSVSLVLPNGSDLTAVVFEDGRIILSTQDATPAPPAVTVTLDQFNQFHGAVLTLCIKETKNKRGQNHG